MTKELTAFATDYGRASAMKLCRSMMIKGWEALIVDCAAAAKTWKVEGVGEVVEAVMGAGGVT